jgi:hypothetical protein
MKHPLAQEPEEEKTCVRFMETSASKLVQPNHLNNILFKHQFKKQQYYKELP